MALDPQNIPAELIPLLPMAEKWGSGDDLIRTMRVEGASHEEAVELIVAVGGPDYPLFQWLAGPESFSKSPTQEYIAFCNLVEAYDDAKSRLKRGYYQ